MAISDMSREELMAEVAVLREEISALRVEHDRNEEPEEWFRTVAENSPSMIFINQGGHIVYANPRSAELLGYTVAELIGAEFDFRRLVAAENQASVRAAFAEHQAGRDVAPYEYTVISRDGRRIEAMNATRLINYRGQPAILGVVTDISDLVAIRRALQESERLYRTVLDTCLDAVAFVALDGSYLMANRAAAEMQGFDSVAELLASDVNVFASVRAEERGDRALGRMNELLSAGSVRDLEYTTVDRHGDEHPRSVNASLVTDEAGNARGFISISRDITARKRAEEERLELERRVLHAQKLESLGLLAGGIAHDFNNLLTGIMGNASLAMHRLAGDHPVRQQLERIEIGSRRAVELTSQMLAYAGKGNFDIGAVDLGRLVAEMSQLFDASVPKKVGLVYRIDADLPAILGDSAQLQQLVMNLITNAAEAIGDEVVGAITVCGSLCSASDAGEILRRDGAVGDGRWICVEVADTGCGMDADTRARIFDPFFTTKFAGRGLGLAAVLGIVRAHCGDISVTSAPGEGSIFRLIFPATDEVVELGAEDETGALELVGSGRILVVDDEDMVREVAGEMLAFMGFAVTTAATGRQAIELFAEHQEEVVAVLLDLTMPELSGEEVLKAIHAIRKVPVVLSSGYDEDEVSRRVGGLGAAGFIHKPYQLRQLARVLKNAIG